MDMAEYKPYAYNKLKLWLVEKKDTNKGFRFGKIKRNQLKGLNRVNLPLFNSRPPLLRGLGSGCNGFSRGGRKKEKGGEELWLVKFPVNIRVSL